MMKIVLYLCGILKIPQSNNKKNIRQMPNKGHSTKYFSAILKTLKVTHIPARKE